MPAGKKRTAKRGKIPRKRERLVNARSPESGARYTQTGEHTHTPAHLRTRTRPFAKRRSRSGSATGGSDARTSSRRKTKKAKETRAEWWGARRGRGGEKSLPKKDEERDKTARRVVNVVEWGGRAALTRRTRKRDTLTKIGGGSVPVHIENDDARTRGVDALERPGGRVNIGAGEASQQVRRRAEKENSKMASGGGARKFVRNRSTTAAAINQLPSTPCEFEFPRPRRSATQSRAPRRFSPFGKYAASDGEGGG